MIDIPVWEKSRSPEPSARKRRLPYCPGIVFLEIAKRILVLMRQIWKTLGGAGPFKAQRVK